MQRSGIGVLGVLSDADRHTDVGFDDPPISPTSGAHQERLYVLRLAGYDNQDIAERCIPGPNVQPQALWRGDDKSSDHFDPVAGPEARQLKRLSRLDHVAPVHLAGAKATDDQAPARAVRKSRDILSEVIPALRCGMAVQDALGLKGLMLMLSDQEIGTPCQDKLFDRACVERTTVGHGRGECAHFFGEPSSVGHSSASQRDIVELYEAPHLAELVLMRRAHHAGAMSAKQSGEYLVESRIARLAGRAHVLRSDPQPIAEELEVERLARRDRRLETLGFLRVEVHPHIAFADGVSERVARVREGKQRNLRQIGDERVQVGILAEQQRKLPRARDRDPLASCKKASAKRATHGRESMQLSRPRATRGSTRPISASLGPGQQQCLGTVGERAQSRHNALMRADADQNTILRAVVKAIEATFDRSRWLELALATDNLDRVKGHRRLLRSLDWGDPDYSACVIEMAPFVLGRTKSRANTLDDLPATPWDSFPNLGIVENFLGLPAWLREHEPELYRALYVGEDEAALDELQSAADELGVPDIDEHAVRIRRGLRDDPAQAIGSSKELLETVLKAVLGLHGTGPETKIAMPKLVKKANVALGLDAAGVRDEDAGAQQRRQLLGSLSHIVNSAAELRNAGFGTGHGHSQRPALDVATARLVVSAAVAAATFYIEAHAASQADED